MSGRCERAGKVGIRAIRFGVRRSFASVLAGSLLLCCVSLLQKTITGYQVAWTSFLVPALVGGMVGWSIERLTARIRGRLVDLDRALVERGEVAEALRSSNERLQLALQGADLGTWDWNVQTGEVSFNDRWAEMLGHTLDEIAPHVDTWAQLVHPEDMPEVEKVLGEHLRCEIDVYETEHRLRHRSGAWIWVLDRGRVIERAPDGTPIRACGTHLDITEKKQAQLERQRLISAIEQTTETIVITDTQGVIQYANPAFEKITGYTCDQARGQKPSLLKSGEHDAEFYRGMWETIRNGDTWTGRIVNRRKDATTYTEEAVISPVRDASGQIVNFVAVKRDITAEIEMEQQLRQAQKMEAVGRLAGGVAHDFNNMLSVILGHTELAHEGANDPESLRESLGEIRVAANRSADLTRQLLGFARKQTVVPKILDLDSVVTEILDMLRRLIGEHIELNWKPGGELPPVKMDCGQIDQILTNLCVNARDAITTVGAISIETALVHIDGDRCTEMAGTVPGDYVQLSVSDDGCGMDPEIVGKAFEPFFTTKGVGQGTGLGLATVFGIVKQNGGFIAMDSEPGLGTAVKVHLPAHAGATGPVRAQAGTSALVSGDETVLIVEDEPSILSLGRAMLTRLGYHVLTAATPAVARQLFRQHGGSIDLLFTDVIMPEVSGPELAREMRVQHPDLKVLFVSGHTADVIASHGMLDAKVKFLQKPFSYEDLAGKVREVLETAGTV